MEEVLSLLTRLGISYKKFDHPAVFSCEESAALCPPMPGISTKQLFIAEKKGGRVFLVIVAHDKMVDMKKLAEALDAKPLQFGKSELLQELLHVTPGSVTPFGLLFDIAHKMEVFFDEDAWNIGTFQFHPLINTATLVIDQNGFETWLAHTGHAFRTLTIPQKGA